MKILQINCVYNEGSTGKLVKLLHHHILKQGWDSIVLYGRGLTFQEEGVIRLGSNLYGKINKLISKLSGLMYGGCRLNTRKAIKIIKSEEPDVVHIHCLNGNFINIYKLISWLNKYNIKTVLTLHAEFMHTANCSHAFECNKWQSGCGNCPRWKTETGSLFRDRTALSWKKMFAAFKDFHGLEVVSVSPWLMERAKQSPILANAHHRVILNGIDTSVFKPCSAHPLISRLKSECKKVILHVTPGFNLTSGHLKGGEYVVELANRLLNEQPDWRIVVAGPLMQDSPIPQNIITLGRIKNQSALASLYSGADITLLTSKKETFSMVTAESLCCGTPVAGFRAGAPEQIAIREYSKFVSFGSINQIIDALNVLTMDKNKSKIAVTAERKYSLDIMLNSYSSLYLKLSDRHNG